MVAAYGIDPVLFMLAAQSFALDESELGVAGGITGRPVELTKAEFVSLPIPENAEFVIEGVLRQGDVMLCKDCVSVEPRFRVSWLKGG